VTRPDSPPAGPARPSRLWLLLVFLASLGTVGFLGGMVVGISPGGVAGGFFGGIVAGVIADVTFDEGKQFPGLRGLFGMAVRRAIRLALARLRAAWRLVPGGGPCVWPPGSCPGPPGGDGSRRPGASWPRPRPYCGVAPSAAILLGGRPSKPERGNGLVSGRSLIEDALDDGGVLG